MDPRLTTGVRYAIGEKVVSDLPRLRMEGWLSGLRRTTRNRESDHKLLRGFESHPFRIQVPPRSLSASSEPQALRGSSQSGAATTIITGLVIGFEKHRAAHPDDRGLHGGRLLLRRALRRRHRQGLCHRLGRAGRAGALLRVPAYRPNSSALT